MRVLGRLQIGQQLVGQVGTIADQHHVAARLQGRTGPGRDVTGHGGRFHRQVVRKDQAVEPQAAAQDGLQPFPGEPGRLAVHLRVDDVGGHDGGERRAQPCVGSRVIGQDLVQAARVLGHGDMRIGISKAVAGEVLAAVGHAGQQQTMGHAAGQHGNHARVVVEGPVADDGGTSPVQIQHRREGEVHPGSTQLLAHAAAHLGGLAAGRQHVRVPALAQGTHGGDGREALAEALHTAALVIDRHQQRRRADGMDLVGQRAQLLGRLVVAGKEDDAAHQRVAQALALGLGQAQAGHIDDDGARCQMTATAHRGAGCAPGRAGCRGSLAGGCGHDERRESGCLETGPGRSMPGGTDSCLCRSGPRWPGISGRWLSPGQPCPGSGPRLLQPHGSGPSWWRRPLACPRTRHVRRWHGQCAVRARQAARRRAAR